MENLIERLILERTFLGCKMFPISLPRVRLFLSTFDFSIFCKVKLSHLPFTHKISNEVVWRERSAGQSNRQLHGPQWLIIMRVCLLCAGQGGTSKYTYEHAKVTANGWFHGKLEHTIRKCTLFFLCSSRCDVQDTNEPCQGHGPDMSLFMGQ